jgi:hypothetical protein
VRVEVREEKKERVGRQAGFLYWGMRGSEEGQGEGERLALRWWRR